jgi:hypothetical protein
VIARRERVIAAVVQAAPLLGIPLYLAALAALQNLLVFFFPGLFMLAAGLIAALLGRVFSPPGFARTESGASLRFHAIAAAVVVVVFPVLFAALISGAMGAAQILVLLFGVLLSLAEIVRALVCGVGALRAVPPPPLPEG